MNGWLVPMWLIPVSLFGAGIIGAIIRAKYLASLAREVARLEKEEKK